MLCKTLRVCLASGTKIEGLNCRPQYNIETHEFASYACYEYAIYCTLIIRNWTNYQFSNARLRKSEQLISELKFYSFCPDK